MILRMTTRMGACAINPMLWHLERDGSSRGRVSSVRECPLWRYPSAWSSREKCQPIIGFRQNQRTWIPGIWHFSGRFRAIGIEKPLGFISPDLVIGELGKCLRDNTNQAPAGWHFKNDFRNWAVFYLVKLKSFEHFTSTLRFRQSKYSLSSTETTGDKTNTRWVQLQIFQSILTQVSILSCTKSKNTWAISWQTYCDVIDYAKWIYLFSVTWKLVSPILA